MKGFNKLILEILIVLIGLVVVLSLIAALISEQKPTTFMNLPGGVEISLESADTKIFVLPPVVWFGKELSLNGNSVNFKKVFNESNTKPTDFIFPTNSVYIKEVIGFPSTKNFEYLDILVPALFFATVPSNFLTSFKNPVTLTYIFTVKKPVSPIIAFYPLITDDFGSPVSETPAKFKTMGLENFYHLDPKKPFGTINFTLTIDVKELKKYYSSKHKIFDKDKAEDNINLNLNYLTDLDYKPNNYLKILGINKNTTTLGDLKSRGICRKDSNIYTCSFVFDVAKKCCPTFVIIKPIFIVNLNENGVQKRKEEKIDPISFQIVYYLDYLKNQDFVFKNFSKIRESFNDEINPNPVKNILIYPCRAIVRLDKSQIPLLPSRVKSFNNKMIDWGECQSANNFIQLKYKDLNKKSTWFCKNSNGNYFLYNPYAFCKLNGNELPEIPVPVYLQGIIPSGSFKKMTPSIPIYVGPGWTPKGGWSLYLFRNPEIVYKTYRETALVWATYMIYRTTKTLTEGGNIIFPESIFISPITLKFKFFYSNI